MSRGNPSEPMRQVFAHQEYARVGFYKSILDEAGIVSLVRNRDNYDLGLATWPCFPPSLYVVNDDDYDRAMTLLGQFEYAEPSAAPDWQCPACQTEVPANFDSCWKCGAARPATDAGSGHQP